MKGSIILLFLSFLLLAGCSTLVLTPGDFSWPVESVSKVNERGMIEDGQYYFTLNVKNLLFAELQDSVNISDVTLRIIRNSGGYYFITASKFNNVYIFKQSEGGLELRNKILVAEQGLSAPAFNLRSPYIQLLNEPNPPLMLTEDGVLEGGKE